MVITGHQVVESFGACDVIAGLRPVRLPTLFRQCCENYES